MSGAGSERASDRYSACIPMKSNCRVSSSPPSPPKYSSCWSNGRFTSPSRTASLRRRCRKRRMSRRYSCGSPISTPGGASMRKGTASTRKPVMPSSSQKPIILAISSRTLGVGDVQVGLVAVEAVQEVLPARLVELPDARLLAGEDGLRLLLRRLVDPDVEVAELRRATAPGIDEPRMPVGGVIDDEVDDDPDAAIVRRADDLDEVAVAAEPRVDAVEVGDVVAVVAVGARVEGHQPQARHAEVGEVVDALREPGEVADAVAVAVEERLDVEAVDDRGLPPQIAGVADLHDALPQPREQLGLGPPEEPLLVLADVVQVDAVEADADEPGDPLARARRHRARSAPPRASRRRPARPPPRRTPRAARCPSTRAARPGRCATDPSRSRGPRHPSARARCAPAARPVRGRRARGTPSSTSRSASGACATVARPSAHPASQPAVSALTAAPSSGGGSAGRLHTRASCTRDVPVVRHASRRRAGAG